MLRRIGEAAAVFVSSLHALPDELKAAHADADLAKNEPRGNGL
ncbi:hypothetical protein BSU04_07435 [Caballeronia sordidicola]|uniref:Uncharacterized protein n=1 Tax=Caballeronia sordidicola TaxID=196367 RepID=A0A226X7P6_CABSO|nr:hypothetical protein BSU04_07435 [Caballeronia sordidicola]